MSAGLQEFQTDGKVRVRRPLAICDASPRVEITRQRNDQHAVIGPPAARSHDSGAALTDVFGEYSFDIGHAFIA